MTQTVSRRPSSAESTITGPTLPQPRRLTSAPTTQRLRKAIDGSRVGANIRAKTRALGRLAWIGSAVVMFVLATARLSWPAMWGDELATWGMTGVPWHAMPALLGQFDVVLGPYYYVMRAWAEVFGTSDLALRMPSVLAMTAAAAGVAMLGTRLANPRVGFTAGLLFAVFPVTSRFAQEARPYALAICLAVFATLVLVESCSGRQRRARVVRFAPYALLVALLGLVHAVALSLLVFFLADIVVPFILMGSFVSWGVTLARGTRSSLYADLPLPGIGWQALLLIAGLAALLSTISLGVRFGRHFADRPTHLRFLPAIMLINTFVLMPIRVAGFVRMAHDTAWGTRAGSFPGRRLTSPLVLLPYLLGGAMLAPSVFVSV